MFARRWLCWLLAIALVAVMLPVQALAVTHSEFQILETWHAEVAQRNATSLPDLSLSSGNHEQWINRIADLPDFASDFYTWLEDNANADGALADPTLGSSLSGSYVYVLSTIQGSTSYTGFSGSTAEAKAEAAIAADLGDVPSQIASYGAAVFGAFDRDHPEVFWLSGSSVYACGTSYSYGGGTVKYTAYVYFYLKNDTFDLRKADYQTVSAIRDEIAVRDAAVEDILADCPTEDAVDQIYYLNNILTKTNAYNSAVGSGNVSAASPDAWECVSALRGQTGVDGPVCEGYARAFNLLCDELGIPCVLAEGPATPSADTEPGGHMWNLVMLDGAWYAVDVTWNDPYVFGSDVAISGYESEEWLLQGSTTVSGTGLTFAQSHQETNMTTTDSLSYINGPVLAKKAYQRVTAPTFTLKYPTLLLEDEIVLSIYFTLDQTDFDLNKIGLLTWTQKPDTVEISTAEAVIWGAEYDAAVGLYRVFAQGIPAQQLGDEIYFCIFAELDDGTYAYGKQVNYCPKTFAYNQLSLDSVSDAAKALYVSMLNYGAAAQTYLGYKSDALINATLSADMQSLVREYSFDMVHGVSMPATSKQGDFVKTDTGFSAKQPTVSLEEAFSINYYFTTNQTVAGDVTFYYWNQADFDACQVLTVDNATGTMAMVSDGSRYGAAIQGIAAKDIDSALYACGVYTDGAGNTCCTGVLPYSLGFYCGNQASTGSAEMRPIAQAIAVYGFYAMTYFA